MLRVSTRVFILAALCCLPVQSIAATAQVGIGRVKVRTDKEDKMRRSSNPLRPVDKKFSASWQIMRAKFQTAQAATQTESFSETWVLRQTSRGELLLISPRAQVTVRLTKVAHDPAVPESLQVELSDLDFARLIGVEMPLTMPLEPLNQAGAETRRIHLALQSGGVFGKDVVLYASDDEHLAVHLDRH